MLLDSSKEPKEVTGRKKPSIVNLELLRFVSYASGNSAHPAALARNPIETFFPFKLNLKEVFSILQFAGKAEQRVICRLPPKHYA